MKHPSAPIGQQDAVTTLVNGAVTSVALQVTVVESLTARFGSEPVHAGASGSEIDTEVSGMLPVFVTMIVLALVVVQWAYFARVVRGTALVERGKEYVEAAVSLDLSHSRIVFSHLLPNCIPPIIVTWPDPAYLRAFTDDIRALKARCDVVVASCHWGLGKDVLQYMRDNVAWDALRDYSPVSLLMTSPNIVVVHPSLPARSLKDVISLARARPGQLNYASTGSGSAGR